MANFIDWLVENANPLDNPLADFVFPRGVTGTAKAQINPAEAMLIQQERADQMAKLAPFLPPPLGGIPAQAAMLAMGSKNPFLPRNMFDVRPGSPLSRIPGIRSAPKPSAATGSGGSGGDFSENTEEKTSQQVQAQQEVQSRPANSAGPQPVGNPHLNLGRTRAAMEQFPVEMARARNLGSPDTNNLTRAMIEGEVDPNLALARGWITQNKYNTIQRIRRRRGLNQSSAVGPTGPQTAQLSPGQRQQVQPDTTGQRQQAERQSVSPSVSTPPAEKYPEWMRSDDALSRRFQNIYDRVNWMKSQGLITEDTELGDIPEELWEESAKAFPVGMTAELTFGLDPQLASNDPETAIRTYLNARGLPDTSFPAQQLLNNANDIVFQFGMETSAPGSITKTMDTFYKYLDSRLLDTADSARPGAPNLRKVYADQLQQIFQNPESQAYQVINERVEQQIESEQQYQNGDPSTAAANVYLATVLYPAAKRLGISEQYFDSLGNAMQQRSRQWYAQRMQGYQGTFAQYLMETGWDPLFVFGLQEGR